MYYEDQDFATVARDDYDRQDEARDACPCGDCAACREVLMSNAPAHWLQPFAAELAREAGVPFEELPF